MEYVKYDLKQRAEFKKNLKRLMDEKGVTKAQLSRKLGWSYNTIDYWLRGDRVPDRLQGRERKTVYGKNESNKTTAIL